MRFFHDHSSSSSKRILAAAQQCAKLQACSCRQQSGTLAAVSLAKVGTAEAHLLPEAKAYQHYQHCKQLQYQVVPGVLAAGPAIIINGMAYLRRLLITCLLHVGFSDCLSAKYEAMHPVKALHDLQLPHRDIRESSILCISEADHTCKGILIHVGYSRLCIPESASCTILFDRDVSAMDL